MKPMLKYRGGKSNEIPHIVPHIPNITGRYVEPFFGGGAVFFYLEPRQSIINDINTKLMEFYVGVRDDYAKLRDELDMLESVYTDNRFEFDQLKLRHPNEHVADKNEDYYYDIRAMFNGTIERKLSKAAIYYYINKTAYSGMIRYNAKGEFNVPFGRYKHLNTECITSAHSNLLQHTDIYNKDYYFIFNLCQKDDFVFLDPPYDCVFSDYGNDEYKEGFNEDNHRRLANDFFNLPCKAMMVIGHTQLTDELYGNHIVDEYQKNYAVNIRNRFKSEARHIIVTNYKE